MIREGDDVGHRLPYFSPLSLIFAVRGFVGLALIELTIERPILKQRNRPVGFPWSEMHILTASPLMVWLSNRSQVAGTLVVSKEVAAPVIAGDCGVGRNDVISIQGDYTKSDVLHVYDEEGTEIARGLTNYSSEETMLMARHRDVPAEDLIGYKTTRDVIAAICKPQARPDLPSITIKPPSALAIGREPVRRGD